MRRVRRVHFVGVGGAGMGGIAEVLQTLGFEVSGSDLKATNMTRRLEELGVNVGIGHRAANVSNADVVVTSTAVPDDNPELEAARLRAVPVDSPSPDARRADALSARDRGGRDAR